MPKSSLRRSFYQLLENELSKEGFAQKPTGCFYKALSPEAKGFVGVGSILQQGTLRINVTMGVLQLEIERFIARIDKRAPKTEGATIVRHIGYLMPHGKHLFWYLDADEAKTEVCGLLLDAIASYGLPFIERHRTVREVASCLQHNDCDSYDRERVLPAALL